MFYPLSLCRFSVGAFSAMLQGCQEKKKCVTSLTSSWLCRLCSYQIKYIIYYTLAETIRFGGGTKTVWKAYDSGVSFNAK